MTLDDDVARRFAEAAATLVDPPQPLVDSDIGRFLQFRVEIPAFSGSLIVTSLVPNQAFTGVYEGVADARGTFQFRDVSGTAWNEQAL